MSVGGVYILYAPSTSFPASDQNSKFLTFSAMFGSSSSCVDSALNYPVSKRALIALTAQMRASGTVAKFSGHTYFTA